MSLSNKVIAITGGFGSLGRAVAQVAAAQGARVALLDRAPAPASGLPEGAVALGETDLSTADGANAAFARVAEKLGGLDGLVNIAGGFKWETIEAGTLESWDQMYNINLRTAVAASKAALPHLLKRGGGRIVNVGANAAAKAALGMGAYAASKAGVARFTEALAEELKDKNINVNAVLPSIIDTAPNRKDMPDADFSRWVPPVELGHVIAFLLGPGAKAVTGALIPVINRV